MSQHMEALKVANEIRIQGARQRRELTGASIREVVQALIHPSRELASMRLKHLFASNRHAGPIPRIGPYALEMTLEELARENPYGRLTWSPELHLRDLTENERRKLVRALIARAPQHWRAA